MNKRIADKQIIFFISYGLFLVMSLLRTTLYYHYLGGTKFKLGFVFCVLLVIAGDFFLNTNTRRMIVGLLITCAYIAVSFLTQEGENMYFFVSAAIFVYASRNIPFRKIAKFSVAVLALLMLFVIASSQIGIIKDFVSDDGRNRHYLGFRYALYPSTVLMNITMLYVYIRKQRIMWLEILALAAFNAAIYVVTGSRLAVIISFVVCFMAAFLKVWPEFLSAKKVLKYIISMAFIIFAALSLFMSVKFNENSAIQSKLNDVLSGRLYYQKEAMDRYGFSVLGNDVELKGEGLTAEGEKVYKTGDDEYFYIDNNYVSWFVINGAVFFVMIVGLCTAMCIRSVRYERQGYLLMILALMALFCMIQDTFLNVHFNTFLLAAGNLVLNTKTEEEIEAEDPGNHIAWRRIRVRFAGRIRLRKAGYGRVQSK